MESPVSIKRTTGYACGRLCGEVLSPLFAGSTKTLSFNINIKKEWGAGFLTPRIKDKKQYESKNHSSLRREKDKQAVPVADASGGAVFAGISGVAGEGGVFFEFVLQA